MTVRYDKHLSHYNERLTSLVSAIVYNEIKTSVQYWKNKSLSVYSLYVKGCLFKKHLRMNRIKSRTLHKSTFHVLFTM